MDLSLSVFCIVKSIITAIISRILSYNISQTQFQPTTREMLNILATKLINPCKMQFKNVFFRTAQKATKDLYELLGVTKNADPKQIKKAYYKLAQQYHPDKNPSPEAKQKFTQINNAYQILSDPTKRQMYDQTGQTGQGNAAGFNQQNGNFNQEDIFNHFRGGFGRGQAGGFEDILKDLFRGGFQSNQGRGQSGEYEISTMNLSLSFQQSVKGCKRTLEYEKKCTCSACKGTKCKPGTQPQKCKSCDGSGMQSIRQGLFVMQTTCGSCGGVGQRIKHYCGSCNGSGIEKKRVKQQINIPRGINDGMTIKLQKKGNFDGDLIIKVQVRKSTIFVREGHNAVSQIQISALDAILGAEKQVVTIEGQKRKINIPQGIQHGQKITLKDQGFYLVNSSTKGDHIITIKIVIPRQLTAQQRSLYQKLKAIGK